MKFFLGAAAPLIGLASWYIDPYLPDTPEKSALFAALFFTAIIALSASGLKLYRPKLTLPHILLYIAICGFWASTLFGLESRQYSTRDWGVAALQTFVPVAALLFPNKDSFLKNILLICVFIASIDFFVNALAITGLLDVVTSGRVDEHGFRIRYQGISGNTHAAGLVGFLGLFFLGTIIKNAKYVIPLLLLSACLFLSLYLIDARRYMVMALLAWGVLLTPVRRQNAAWLVAFLAGSMIAMTFSADFADRGNQLRADLMETGLYNALKHPILGEGPRFIDLEGLKQTHRWMSDAGITESIILEFCRSYGVLSTLVFLAAILTSLPNRYYPPAILLALMTGELFFGGVITGYFGSIVFFGCFHACVELRAKSQHVSIGSRPTYASVRTLASGP